MKKSRIITAAVLAATMLMGAGYAAWTSTVDINHSVTTGNMDVRFITPNYSFNEALASNYVKADVNRSANNPREIGFTLKNLYPGAQYSTLTEEKNTGTIPVTFDSATVTFDKESNEALQKNTTVSFVCCIFDRYGSPIKIISPRGDVQLSNLGNVLSDTLKNVKLEPGQSLRFQGNSIEQLMTFTLNDGTNLDNTTQNKTLNFTIQLNWKQFNK